MQPTITIKKSKARMLIALAYALAMVAVTCAIVYNPAFREHPNWIGFGIAAVGSILFFPILVFTFFYSVADTTSLYTLNPYYCVCHKIYGEGFKDRVADYRSVSKISVNIPRWSNFLKVFYADITLVADDGSKFMLEAVPDWEETLIYVVGSVAQVRRAPLEELFGNLQTEIAYSVAVKRLEKRIAGRRRQS
jgi:hypothetical protein